MKYVYTQCPHCDQATFSPNSYGMCFSCRQHSLRVHEMTEEEMVRIGTTGHGTLMANSTSAITRDWTQLPGYSELCDHVLDELRERARKHAYATVVGMPVVITLEKLDYAKRVEELLTRGGVCDGLDLLDALLADKRSRAANVRFRHSDGRHVKYVTLGVIRDGGLDPR